MEATFYVNGKHIPAAELKTHTIKNETVSQIIRGASNRAQTAYPIHMPNQTN